MLKILILYYSQHGSVANLANQISHGVESTRFADAVLRTVPAVSPLCEKQSNAVPESGPPFVTHDDLRQCDGLILGSPTRFGNMAAPLSYFLGTTTNLWFSGELVGKPAALFTSTASFHGGQESTLLSMMLPLLHHGMVIVGLPFTEPALLTTTAGGTPYGASHIAGNNNDPSLKDEEIALARKLGERIATVAKQLKKPLNHQ